MAIVDGYATLPEVKAALRLSTTVDDTRLERAIEGASRTIDRVTKRKFTTVTEQRTYSTDGYTVWVDDAASVTSVEESSNRVTWVAIPFASWVANARPPIRSLVRIDGGQWADFVRISATWGSARPDELVLVREACVILAVRYFKRADTPEGVLVGDFGAARLARIDPDVHAMIRPLARKVVG